MTLNSRQRVLAAFAHQEPDRVPLDLGSRGSSLALSAYADLKKHLGLELPGEVLDQRLGLARIDEVVLERFGADTRYVYLKPASSWDPRTDPVNDTLVDEWGGTLRRPRGGLYYDHVDFPFKEPDPAAIRRHPFPDPDDPSRYRGLREEAKRYYEQGYAVGTYLKGVFETLWILRGMENTFRDMTLNQKFIQALADRTSEIMARMIENFFAEVGDYVSTSASPATWAPSRACSSRPGLPDLRPPLREAHLRHGQAVFLRPGGQHSLRRHLQDHPPGDRGRGGDSQPHPDQRRGHGHPAAQAGVRPRPVLLGRGGHPARPGPGHPGNGGGRGAAVFHDLGPGAACSWAPATTSRPSPGRITWWTSTRPAWPAAVTHSPAEPARGSRRRGMRDRPA